MLRLFSTFARGLPGAGLLLLRVAAGSSLVVYAVQALIVVARPGPTALHVLAAGVGVLLLLGLWTPVAGALAVLYVAWEAFSNPGDARFLILLGALSAALALTGPGGWSIDARLFGWKRIEIDSKK